MKIFKTTPQFLLGLVLILSFKSTSYAQVVVDQDWAVHFESQDSLIKNATITDQWGFLYVAGYTMDPSTGADILLTKYNSKGYQEWSVRYSGTGYQRDHATAVTVDNYGNVYVTGVISINSTYTELIVISYTSDGNYRWHYMYSQQSNGYNVGSAIYCYEDNLYVIGASEGIGTSLDYATLSFKLDGSLIWASHYDYNNLWDIPIDVKVDSLGKIVVAGISQSIAPYWDYATIVYNEDGTIYSTNRVSGSNLGFDQIHALALDSSNNIYITGATFSNTSQYDFITLKLNPAGQLQWIQNYDYNNLNDKAHSNALDSNGDIYVAGASRSTSTDYDFTIIKYDSFGNNIWTRRFDHLGYADLAYKVVINVRNEIIVTGESWNGTDWDFLTLCYDVSGALRWVRVYDSPYNGDDRAADIKVEDNGTVYVTGQSFNGIEYEYTTVKYRTHDYIIPYDTIPCPTSFAIYENRGQLIDNQDSVRNDILFYSHRHSPALYFFENKLSYVFSSVDTIDSTIDTLHRVDMSFDRASYLDRPYGLDTVPGFLNYNYSHCQTGIMGIKGYQRLYYPDVYPDIDVMFYGNNSGMKYYIIVKPEADRTDLKITFEGADALNITTNGELEIISSVGSVIFASPHVFQIDANNNNVSLNWNASYFNAGNGKIGFNLGPITNNLPLVIVVEKINIQYAQANNLFHSTYYGGSHNDFFTKINYDNQSNILICGYTFSTTFPTATGTNTGTIGTDIIVLKKDYNLLDKWGWFIGGTLNDEAHGIVADSDGNIFITGRSNSTDFPVTISPPPNVHVQPTLAGGFDIIIMKLNGVGEGIGWSTYYGGPSTSLSLEQGYDVAINSNDEVFVVGRGETGSPLYTKSGAFNSTTGNGIILQFSNIGERLWATMFGGSGGTWIYSANVDNSNNLLITGFTNALSQFPSVNLGNGYTQPNPGAGGHGDAFVAKFLNNGSIYWSTYFGGNHWEYGNSITSDDIGNIYITGETFSTNFPIFNAPVGFNTYTGPAWNPSSVPYGNVFISKFSSTGVALKSFYYGHTGGERGSSIFYKNNHILITGATKSTNFPLITNPGIYYSQTTLGHPNGIDADAFILMYDQDLNQRYWTTYFGGGGHLGTDYANSIIAVGNKVFLIGGAGSESFPTYNQGNGAYFQPLMANASAEAFLSSFVVNVLGTSIYEYSPNEKSKCFVHPTLVTNTFTLEDCSNIHKIELYNQIGQRMDIQDIDINNCQFAISHLRPGIYILKITRKNSIFETCKIVKM